MSQPNKLTNQQTNVPQERRTGLGCSPELFTRHQQLNARIQLLGMWAATATHQTREIRKMFVVIRSRTTVT